MKQDMILILDLGSEENPRLAREIRAMGVYTEIHPHDITAGELAALPGVTYTGISGDISFNDTGDANRDAAYIKTANTETGVWDFVAIQKAA